MEFRLLQIPFHSAEYRRLQDFGLRQMFSTVRFAYLSSSNRANNGKQLSRSHFKIHIIQGWSFNFLKWNNKELINSFSLYFPKQTEKEKHDVS